MSAEVLHLPSRPDSQPFYHNSGLHSNLIRRPSPSPSLFIERPTLPSSPSRTPDHCSETREWLPVTPPPSAAPSLLSPDVVATKASARVETRETESPMQLVPTLEPEISLPNYDGDRPSNLQDQVLTPPSSPVHKSNFEEQQSEAQTSSSPLRSDSPLSSPTVADDTAVRREPSRQVDFLSHEWREEDIWSSWRHIVSQRSTYGERSRLENASWRTWAKSKYKLSTVSPEKLNWLKESDVTWLYGPLKSATSYPITQSISNSSANLTKNNSFMTKKPILKKRSVSEVMLQRSISTSSLLKQAAASIEAQGRVSRKNSMAVDSKLQSETPSRDQMDYFTSRSTSSGGTPGERHEKRRIRFDNRVEQCIAVDCKEVGGDFADDSDGEDDGPVHHGSDSDDGLLMMPSRRRSIKARRPSGHSRNNSYNGMKTIETLPATTLKYRTDSPDVTAEAQHHIFSRSWNGGTLSPSASQETLRPSNPSTNFLLPEEEDDDEEVDSDSSWSFGASNPKSSLGASASSRSSGSRNRSSTPVPQDRDLEMYGMRRTGSGMFMPYDDVEDDMAASGILGRVSETINTAKDIAHVIWNVGWRK